MKDTTPQAVQAAHELILWHIPHPDKFPRVRRFTLGERLEAILLEVLELLVEAAYSRGEEKLRPLRRANLRLEVARHLWRLALELQTLSTRHYEYGGEVDERTWPAVGWLAAGQRRSKASRVGRNGGNQMKRYGDLWPQVVSFENLLLAYRKARRGKGMRAEVGRFALNLEPEILGLQRELETGEYSPGGYRLFTIYERKPRVIAAAPFRDRSKLQCQALHVDIFCVESWGRKNRTGTRNLTQEGESFEELHQIQSLTLSFF